VEALGNCPVCPPPLNPAPECDPPMHRGMPSAKNAAFIRSARPSCVRAISFGRVRHVTRETPTATRRRSSVTAISRTTTTGDVSRRTAVGGVVTSTRSTPSSPNVDSSSQTCDRPSTVSDKGRNAPYLFCCDTQTVYS